MSGRAEPGPAKGFDALANAKFARAPLRLAAAAVAQQFLAPQAYHFGVAAAIVEKSRLMDRVDRVHGTSGGAIVSLVILKAPETIRDCLEHYISGEFFEELRAREVLKPHDVLLKRTLDVVGVTRDGAAELLSSKLVAHTTTFEEGLLRPRNVALTDFADDDAAMFRAVSASCCLDLVGVDVLGDGTQHHDGGL